MDEELEKDDNLEEKSLPEDDVESVEKLEEEEFDEEEEEDAFDDVEEE